MKIEKRWIASFAIVAITAIAGLFYEPATDFPSTDFGPLENIVPADVAWLLTASCLVLLMTPGLSFFSSTVTAMPCFARKQAEDNPAKPLPMIVAFKRWFLR